MATFGENLRRERELRGVSLRDVAEATKISSRFLKALEDDRVDILPGGLFPRAFVKQYAKHLGLDADRLVAEFLYAHADALAEPESPKRVQDAPPRGGWFVVVVFLGIGLLWLMRAQPPEDTLVAAPPAPAASEPSDAVFPLPPAALASEALVLTLRADQSCWVEARADGEKVLSRVLGEGETATLEAKGEIVLSVGNAGGLSFSVNNQPGVPLGRAGEVRRNVVITRQNLRSLVESSGPVTASHSS